MDDQKERSRGKIIRLFARYVSGGKVALYEKYGLTLIPGRRGGCTLSDMNGKRYINCHCNGGVFNLGHRNRRIISAVNKAMKSFDIGNHHLVSGPRGELAGMIGETMPSGLNQVVYGVSGGEAVDFAIKLARGVTGRSGIISALGGYHGHTGFALAAGDRKYRDMFRPMAPGFRQVKFNSIPHLEKAVSEKTAAVIMETIPATLGIEVPDPGYFRKLQGICRRKGALFIADEVQTGFGRTGRLWGFENFNCSPDIVVLGKGMSGGIYPISATVYHERLRGFLEENPFIHISTFGGSEIGCLAAMEVLRISRGKNFLDHVAKMGSYIRERLEEISAKYPLHRLKIRGLGLMLGLEFGNELASLGVMKKLFDRGVYTLYSNNNPAVLQFLPPLIIERKTADTVLGRVERALRV